MLTSWQAHLAFVAYNVPMPLLVATLQVSYLNNAQMVFTTLSSSGRSIFSSSQTKASFNLVLIDEAAQASEVQALQPLVYGAKAVVLVGDPQQLPATILSSQAREVEMERSLFQRLQMVSIFIQQNMDCICA